jgi:hypothetical protein
MYKGTKTCRRKYLLEPFPLLFPCALDEDLFFLDGAHAFAPFGHVIFKE